MSVFECLPWPIRMDWVLTVVVGRSVVGVIVVVVGQTFENSKVRSFNKASIVHMLTSNMGGAK